MTRDWPALADAIKGHRKALKLTQSQLATAADTSTSTVQKLESGNGDRHWQDLPDSLPRVERALGWDVGAAVAVLEAGAPAPPLPDGPRRHPASHGAKVSAPEGRVAKDMPLHVKSELAGDRAVVQATVVQGPGDTRFAIVWTADADVDPSELTGEALERWTRLNRAALGLPSGEDKPDG